MEGNQILYAFWNNLLFKHFFNENNSDFPVIIYVDKGLLDDLGKDVGGCDSFVESIVIVDGYPQHLAKRLKSLVCSYKRCSTCTETVPPFFNVLCLTVLAWTVDNQLHAGNYYDRLNGILQKAYEKFGYSIDAFEVGRRRNQRLSALFRSLLERSFKLLEFHTREKLSENLGFYEFRQVGTHYIDIPRAQALLNANDRGRLQRFFFEQGVQPEDDLSRDEVKKLIYPQALHTNYLRQATINCWNTDKENQDVICEIVVSLIKYWDGMYERDTPHHSIGLAGKECISKHSGAYLCPAFRSRGIVGGFELGLRVEYTTQDFPIEPISFVDTNLFDSQVFRQHGGWSGFFSIPREAMEDLFSSFGTKVMQTSTGDDVRFFPKAVHVLEMARNLGGYIPARTVGLGVPYLIFLYKIKAEAFLKANRANLSKLSYSGEVNGWSLYRAENGLLSLIGLERVKSRPDRKVMELSGGARIGHAASQKFSAVVPPRLRVLGVIPEGFSVTCRHGLDEIELLELEYPEDTIFAIPEKKLESGLYEFFVQNSHRERDSRYDPLSFKLITCSMPEKGELAIANMEDDTPFLYKYSDFEFVIDGWEKVNDETFLRPSGNTPLFVTINYLLKGLAVLCDSEELKANEMQYILPTLEDGWHTVKALWHGIEIAKKGIRIPQTPVVKIKMLGATRLAHDKNLWLKHGIDPAALKIDIAQRDGLVVKVFLNGKKISTIQNGIVTRILSKNEPNNLELHWAGKVLQKEEYFLKPLPDILIELERNSGSNWNGSKVYNPKDPPTVQALLEPNEFLFLENLHFFWGDVQLSMEKQDEWIASVAFPKDFDKHRAQQGERQFNVRINNEKVVLVSFPIITIQDRPDCDINIDGEKLKSNVYWKHPKITASLSKNI